MIMILVGWVKHLLLCWLGAARQKPGRRCPTIRRVMRFARLFASVPTQIASYNQDVLLKGLGRKLGKSLGPDADDARGQGDVGRGACQLMLVMPAGWATLVEAQQYTAWAWASAMNG